MLYVSTRNINDSYTAHRALHEAMAPDGGMYVPFHIPAITAEEWTCIKSQGASAAVATMLNLFFGLRLCAADVEPILGNAPFCVKTLNQNLIFAELWHTPEGNSDYYVNGLYRLMTERSDEPQGWARVAIQIALLFAIYGENHSDLRQFDMAIPVTDFADLIAILYAKGMGLPVNSIVCACDEDGIVWDLVNKKEFSTVRNPAYTESLLFKYFGENGVNYYLDACVQKAVFSLEEAFLENVIDDLYPAVVSRSRIDTVISSMFRSNGYRIDSDSAVAYGGLQDYRACTGVNKQTLIISTKRP